MTTRNAIADFIILSFPGLVRPMTPGGPHQAVDDQGVVMLRLAQKLSHFVISDAIQPSGPRHD